MSNNRGKEFEDVVREGLEQVPNSTTLRLYDPMGGYGGVANPCDFVFYKLPVTFYIECKSHKGNRLSINTSNNPKKHYGDITDNQWNSLKKFDKIRGVVAGYLIWFIDRGVTVFVPASEMVRLKEQGHKGFTPDDIPKVCCFVVNAKRKRVYYEYDFNSLYQWGLKWVNKGDIE